DQSTVPIEVGLGVGELRRRRTHLRFPPLPFLRPLARTQSGEGRSGLAELALECLEPSLKFVLPQLANYLSLGRLLPLLDPQFDEQTRDLKGQLDLCRGFNFSREGPHVRLAPCNHDHRLDGTDYLGTGWSV